MAEIVFGALAGFALERLWDIVKELKGVNSDFRTQFQRLEKQWRTLLPLLEKQTTKLEVDLCHELKSCELLISDCSKVPRWNVFQKKHYSEKLENAGKSILVLLQAATFWNTNEIKSRFDEFLLPPLPGKVFGIKTPLSELKQMLRTHLVVGVCGIGGCGKSTLVSVLCDQSDIKDQITLDPAHLPPISTSHRISRIVRLSITKLSEFGELIFLRISSSPDQLPTICQRQTRRLNGTDGRRGKMLIVLDDVSKVDKNIKILVDAVKNAADSRILITSRDKLDICDESYPVNQLRVDDARKLFEHHALRGDRASSWNPNKQLIDEIVSGCKLHPLALEVIGGSLAKGDEREWQDTKNRLKQTGGIFSGRHGDEIIECLSTSLTSLSREGRECFLDLGSFPQGQAIPASAIIDMWTETRDLDENGAYVILRELGRRNLVKLVDRKCGRAGDPDGSFSSLSISQHDLLRELAISKSSSQITRLIMENREVNNPKTWTPEKTRTSQAKLVSVNTGDMGSLDWPDLELPNAEVLILNFSASSYYLPTFLPSMKNLKVLVVANRGSNRVELDGLSLLSSLKKLKRVMFRKIILPAEPLRMVEGGWWSRVWKFVARVASITLGASAEPPQDLQKLSLVLCDVHHMLHMPSLFPIVRDLEVDYCTNLDELPDTICDISNLQKLSITNSPDLLKLADGIDKLSKLKVLRLHACGKLEHLPHSLSKLSELRFLDISDCHDLVAFPQEMEKLTSLEKIDMRSCLSMTELPPSMVQMECLKKVICYDQAASMWLSCGLDPNKLDKRKEDVDLRFLL